MSVINISAQHISGGGKSGASIWHQYRQKAMVIS
jgi:hypothetical protein